MQNSISRENIADIAQQAVKSLRRFVSASHDDLTLLQHDLVNTSKHIEEQRAKNRDMVEASTTDLWSTGFTDELKFQLAWSTNTSTTSEAGHTQPSVPRKPLPEAAMACTLEAARTLSRIGGDAALECFHTSSLVPLLTNYFMQVTLSRKLLELCAEVLTDITTAHAQHLEACLVMSLPYLQCGDNNLMEGTALRYPPKSVHLASILVTAFHRLDASEPPDSLRSRCGKLGYPIEVLRACHTVFTASTVISDAKAISIPGALAASSLVHTCGESYRVTVCVVLLSLLGALARNCVANKLAVLTGCNQEFVTLWTGTVSRLARMEKTISIPTMGKETVVSLGVLAMWESELLELLIEICTDDSFTLRRLHVWGMETLSSPTQQYEPLPHHWDSLLTSGSQKMWQLASSLNRCSVMPAATGTVEVCLMQVDVNAASAEFIYRNAIATLMLLCAANPPNAMALASSSITEILISIVTCQQTSVFPSCITVSLSSGGAQVPVEVSPVCQLNANTTQLTIAFMCAVASVYFPPTLVRMLMKGVESMGTQHTCETDEVIVESLLHVLQSSFMPSSALFFPGNGKVVCTAESFPTRLSGYSFSAWVNPMCVWAEGSHLFSITDRQGGSVALKIVANCRQRFVALRVQSAKDLTVSVVADSFLPPESWSHIAFTHSFGGFVLYINGRRMNVSISVPYPKDASKRYRLCLSFGGESSNFSFLGCATNITVLEGVLSEKDINRLFSEGPQACDFPGYHQLVCIRGAESSGAAEELLTKPVSVTGALLVKKEGVSVHGVIPCGTLDMNSIFAQCGVVSWALRMMEKAQASVSFPIMSKCCLLFVCTAMRITSTNEQLTELLGDMYMERLTRAVLAWEDTPMEFPFIMLTSAIPRGGGKVLRDHPSTQAIFTMLLERVRAMSHPDYHHISVNPFSASCILRELSDCLLVSENVALFQAVPGRFEQVLSMTLSLPMECIRNVVVLIERLCKQTTELEQTMRFLLQPYTSSTAEHAKMEILRMLFDTARGDAGMCGRISGCFKGHCASFLIMLIKGYHHSSEQIRVFALRLLSLMLHANRRFHESFTEMCGFSVLSQAMSDPSSTVPIRLPTLDCLFQMAFGRYRPTEKVEEPMVSRLKSVTRSKGKRGSKGDSSHQGSSSSDVALGLRGHLPGLVPRRFKVARREYSFEVTYDFGKVDDRPLIDAYGSKYADGTLQMPQAIEVVLCMLGKLIKGIGSSYSSRPIKGEPDGQEVGEGCSEEHNTQAEVASSISVASPVSPVEDDSLEKVALRALNYLEMVADVPKNGTELLLFPWLKWLWSAVGVVVDTRQQVGGVGGVDGSPSDQRHKFSKKFTTAVLKHTRSIIRKLAILDLCENSKAATVRSIKTTLLPPYVVRVVLEEVVRHFSQGRDSEMVNPNRASNVLKNLNELFHNVADCLAPFPVALGVEVVNVISTIAVNSNAWVRMKMKSSTRLFETRDKFAFSLLTGVRRYAKVDAKLITQLLDANANEVNAALLVLRRLTEAIDPHTDLDEAERLLAMSRYLAQSDECQRHVIYSAVGESGTHLAGLLCGPADDGRLSATSPDHGSQVLSPTAHAREEGKALGASGDRNGTMAEVLVTDPSGGYSMPPISQVITWRNSHPEQWSAICHSIAKAARDVDATIKSERDRSEKERAAMARTMRHMQDQEHQLENRVLHELKRIVTGVEAEC